MATKLFRYAATIIFTAREGYRYPLAMAPLNDKVITGGLSRHQRLSQLYPHVIQMQDKLDHVRGVDVLFVQRTTEAGFMVCIYLLSVNLNFITFSLIVMCSLEVCLMRQIVQENG